METRIAGALDIYQVTVCSITCARAAHTGEHRPAPVAGDDPMASSLSPCKGKDLWCSDSYASAGPERGLKCLQPDLRVEQAMVGRRYFLVERLWSSAPRHRRRRGRTGR